MDVCAVVKQLRELASDPKNREAIVKVKQISLNTCKAVLTQFT